MTPEPSTTTVVTRFPPSPTGKLHIGGARTALFNWAMARRHGGRFILRMEDTDRARSSREAEESIIRDLKWLGLDWDNEEIARQSERAEQGVYDRAIDQLLAAGHACAEEGKVVRFRMPNDTITFTDIVRGEVATAGSEIDDFVIRKSDGYPTYHLAVVVDDAEMGVTHIIRGQDHLSNTPKHIALQQALLLPTPIYAHMSLTTNPDGSKMGKRDKAKAARKAAMETERRELVERLAERNQERAKADAARRAVLEKTEQGADRDHLVEDFAHKDELLRGMVDPPGPEITTDQIESFLDKENDDVPIAELIAFELKCHLPEINVEDFREAGYLATTMVNYLGLLGWNPGENVEDFGDDPLAFLAGRFEPARLVRGNAAFDRQKLEAFNANAIRRLPPEEFARLLKEQAGRIRPFDPRPTQPWRAFAGAEQRFARFAAAYQERSATLETPFELGRFFIADDDALDYDFTDKNVKKAMLKGEPNGFAALRELQDKLAALPETGFGAAAHDLIKQLAETTGQNMGKYAQPLRVAVSGGTVTPPIDQTLDILGREATLRRIEVCLDKGSVLAE